MIEAIRIIQKGFPKRGYFIDEGEYEYLLTDEGLPGMHLRWQEMIFAGPMATFVFARDVVKICPVPEEAWRGQARLSGFSGGSTRTAGSGLIVSLISGAIGAAAAPTKDLKGFKVLYKNDKGHLGFFMAVARPRIADEILRSVPQDKHHDGVSTEGLPSET